MDIEIISSGLIQPPGSDISSNTLIPLSIFDKAHFNGHFPILHAFHGPMPSNKELATGLSKTLAHFPVLCGRICTDDSNRPYIQLNNAGIKLIEARSQSSLCGIFDGSAMDIVVEQPVELTLLYPPISDTVEELLQIQITRFSCGGVVFGLTSHHSVADGQAISDFISTWADIVRGSSIKEHSFHAYHNRAAFLVPRDPPTPMFNHEEIEFKLTNATTPTDSGSCALIHDLKNIRVEFSPIFIADLKAKIRGKSSTLGCIVAHLWKTIMKARKLSGEEMTNVRIAVGGRMKSRLDMPEPEYFGNLLLWAFPRLSVENVLSGTLAETVKVIHEAIVAVNHEYFQSFIDFGKVMEGREEELVSTLVLAGNLLCPNLEVNSCLSFKFHELEFISGNKPYACITPDLSVEGLIMLMPSCKEKGGVVAFLALLKDEVEEFKRTCFILE